MHSTYDIEIMGAARQTALLEEAQREHVTRLASGERTRNPRLLRTVKAYLRQLLVPRPKITIHNGRKRVA